MSSKQLLPSAMNDNVVTPPNSVQRRKGKPMIVDISLNDNGEQIYKVHGTARSSRKRKLNTDDDYDDERPYNKRMTPVRAILGTISPSTLNQDKNSDFNFKNSNPQLNGSPSTRKPDTDINIWSEDVEDAFEEALRMIPKNGLTKIKISGKSCGRNELISDFILQRTGKIRTRKQVSSHIQVIKNLKKNTELIELINNGPSDVASLQKFDEVFSEISFNKSLGSTGPSSNDMKPSTPINPNRKKNSRRTTPQAPQQRFKRVIPRSSRLVDFSMKRFEISYFDVEQPQNSHTFSKLTKQNIGQALRLKPDACISNRFPNLNDYLHDGFSQEDQVPILHNLSKLRLSDSGSYLNGEHDTTLQVELKNLPADEVDFACITMIYSFGNEVIKLVEDMNIIKISKSLEDPNELRNNTFEMRFAKDFWAAFFNSVEKNVNDDRVKCENQKTIAVKAITMKQVIFNKKRTSGFDKEDIRGIILWEFARSESSHETTSRRLYLPEVEREEIKFLSKLSEPVHNQINGQEDQVSKFEPEDEEEETEEVEDEKQHNIQSPSSYSESSQATHQADQDDDTREVEAPSANTTLQFDEIEQQEIFVNQPTALRTHSIPTFHHPLHTHHQNLRRMQSEPSFWNLQHNQQMPTSTTSTISSDGFNTDEFQGFNPTYAAFNGAPTLNPDMIHMGHTTIKVENEYTPGEVFITW